MSPLSKKSITKEQQNELLNILKERFNKNNKRHPGILWDDVAKKLIAAKDKLTILHAMESSGGEPDVVAFDSKSNEYTFIDCSAESPAGRRSLCYDDDALIERKENKPNGSAVQQALTIGASILTEEDYRFLQTLGKFDTKTSSWIATPDLIRKLGGALFCDRRYNTVFTYHNGAQSYYAARGFRTMIKV